MFCLEAKHLELQPVDVYTQLNRIASRWNLIQHWIVYSTSYWHGDQHRSVDSLSQLADSLIKPGIDLISLNQVGGGFEEHILQPRFFLNYLFN
jgi:hypothetical protein